MAYGYELGLVPQNAYQFVKSLTPSVQLETLTLTPTHHHPRACRCQSLCRLKRFSPLSAPQRACRLLIGAQIAVAAAIHPHQICCRTIFLLELKSFSPLWFWQLSAARGDANRFIPANVVSWLNKQSEFGDKYKLICYTVHLVSDKWQKYKVKPLFLDTCRKADVLRFVNLLTFSYLAITSDSLKIF